MNMLSGDYPAARGSDVGTGPHALVEALVGRAVDLGMLTGDLVFGLHVPQEVTMARASDIDASSEAVEEVCAARATTQTPRDKFPPPPATPPPPPPLALLGRAGAGALYSAAPSGIFPRPAAAMPPLPGAPVVGDGGTANLRAGAAGSPSSRPGPDGFDDNDIARALQGHEPDGVPVGAASRRRPCKGKRDRIKKALALIEAKVEGDPEAFDRGEFFLPPMVDCDPRGRERVLARLASVAAGARRCPAGT